MKKIRSSVRIILYLIIHFVLICYVGFLSIGLYLTLSNSVAYWRTGVALLCISHWPSFALGMYRRIYSGEIDVFDPKIIIINIVGWILVGFIIGLVISAVKGRRRK
jgi:hypothetical protein